MGYETQSRFKSIVAWTTLAALVGFVSKTYFGYEIPEFDKLVDLLLGVLIAFGVLNNPTNKEGF